MAEGGFDPGANRRPNIQQLCRYFMHGACDKGSTCQFVHDRTGTAPSNNICKFYQQGRCFYGKSCRYDHVKASGTERRQVDPQNKESGRLRSSSSESSTTHTCNDSRGIRDDNRQTRDNNRQTRNDNSRQTRNDYVQTRNGSRPNRNDFIQTRNDSRQNRNDYRQTRNGSSQTGNDYTGIQNDNGETWESSFVTLKKDNGQNKGTTLPVDKKPLERDSSKFQVLHKDWAKAKDFIPGQKFHAGATYACKAHDPHTQDEEEAAQTTPDWHKEPREEELMCPYYAHGHCPYGQDCHYVHGEICDTCQMPRLHPTDTVQREAHVKECLKEMEKDMEHSFAVQESQLKECCICLERVVEKTDSGPGNASRKPSKSNNQFGILENCSHCFCLDCIRRWRSDKASFGKNVRVCPICRVHSDFVTPSSVWVEEEAAKKKVIQDYKDALRLKPCHYFKQGKGECPFNEKCFYKHAYPDGTIAEPKPRPKVRRQMNSNGELSTMGAVTLWDFLEVREDGLLSLEDELSLYLLGMLGDSDDDSDDYSYPWMLGGHSDTDLSDSDYEF